MNINKAILVLSFLSFIVSFTSCGSVSYVKNILKSKITVQEAVDRKEQMDKTDNPAFVFERTKELKSKRIRIQDILVKDIVPSTNVDYKFCIIVSVPTNKGEIDCYVYAGTDDIFPEEDIKTISKIKKGVSKIDIEGDFNNFFTLLDETFTKIEIVNASINIKKK